MALAGFVVSGFVDHKIVWQGTGALVAVYVVLISVAVYCKRRLRMTIESLVGLATGVAFIVGLALYMNSHRAENHEKDRGGDA